MKLYLLRHADATYDAPTDEARPLSQRGIERTQTAARVMKKLDLAPLRIYTSPRLRSRQTAEIVADVLGVEIEVTPELDFDFNLNAAQKLLRKLPEKGEVMFVGHNPSMSEVVTDLSGAEISMKKGGMARLDIYNLNPLRGELIWLIAPRVFDALDGG